MQLFNQARHSCAWESHQAENRFRLFSARCFFMAYYSDSKTSFCLCPERFAFLIVGGQRHLPPFSFVSLSAEPAQRLKLASEMGRTQEDSVFVFDEPTIGLHPLDVETLMGVFRSLIGNGATVVVIEHDLDVIRNADYVIDMGPGGGEEGGRIVVCGTPDEIKACSESVTGQFI